MRRALLALPCLLAACGDPGGDYPALIPEDALLQARLPAHATAAAMSPAGITAEVEAAGAASRARARAAADPLPADDELVARAAALRARAEALRQADTGV